MPDKLKTEPVKPKQAKPKPKAVQIKPEQCDALVQLIGVPIAVLSPDDSLTAEESIALSIALLDAANGNVYIANIISNITSVGGIGVLAVVSAAIVGRRVASHAAVNTPEGTQQYARLQMVGMACEGITKNVASRRTSGVSGVDGQRENNPRPDNPQTTPVQDRTPDESGYPGMAGISFGSNGLPYHAEVR